MVLFTEILIFSIIFLNKTRRIHQLSYYTGMNCCRKVILGGEKVTIVQQQGTKAKSCICLCSEQEPFINCEDHKHQFGNAECEALAPETKENVAIINFANLTVPSQSDVDNIPAKLAPFLICICLTQTLSHRSLVGKGELSVCGGNEAPCVPGAGQGRYQVVLGTLGTKPSG